eukprot:scaffold12678_cov167-Skeletonema_dohrnii-CCMP3373.AAC.2
MGKKWTPGPYPHAPSAALTIPSGHLCNWSLFFGFARRELGRVRLMTAQLNSFTQSSAHNSQSASAVSDVNKQHVLIA